MSGVHNNTSYTLLNHRNSEGTHIDQNKFNWLGTIFYLFFLAFEWPQNIALQYLPVGKWMSFNIFVWSVALLCHAAATNFGGLFACRVFLGICEGAITPGFLLVTSMFYTRQEQSQRVGYWCKFAPYQRPFPTHLTYCTSFHERRRHRHARPYCVRNLAYQD